MLLGIFNRDFRFEFLKDLILPMSDSTHNERNNMFNFTTA